MTLLKIVLLAVIQGLAELLPVSSSAHVVVAEKLMGLDVSSPAMTLLLVALHTGTMFAVIVYFWKQWKHLYFSGAAAFRRFAARLILATALTAVIALGLMKIIEKTLLRGVPHAQIEDLFGHLEWIGPALAAAGVLIIVAGVARGRKDRHDPAFEREHAMSFRQAGWIGAVQGFCIPFRGFSRSGATISTGMLSGATKAESEAFSFALAVVLTPAAIGKEVLRVLAQPHSHLQPALGAVHPAGPFWFSLLGMICSFLAGLAALKWLSRWLESDRWYLFGIYCLAASAAVFALHHAGY